jgi:aspartyl-tRNA(Asn)/glutamyl-tRNA(Gln) amidotransferase subunit C
MAHITREDVERIAGLARLSLTEAETERAVSDLEEILSYVDLLDQAETEGVEATSHVIPLATPLRDDAVIERLDPELALSNAPLAEGTAFVVPKVIEGEEEA